MYYYNYLLTIYQFLFGNIQQCPDLYLDELKEILSTTCGQDVSNATIWRLLHHQGFTMKGEHRGIVQINGITTLTADFTSCSRALR